MIYWSGAYEATAAISRADMRHARILWDNRLADATFASPDERDGFAAINARATDTASWWWPAAGATLTMTLAEAAYIDCIAIAAHTLGSAGASITVQAQVGGEWQAVYPTIAPADDEAVMILFQEVLATAVRITLSASARIGVVYAGLALVMPQMVYGDATPLHVTLDTEYRTNQSQTGQFLGRSIVANSRPVDVTWTHLHEAWVREALLPFILAARRAPFFAALRPKTQPEDVGYIWTGSDIKPQRMRLRDFMQVQVSGTAHMGADT